MPPLARLAGGDRDEARSSAPDRLRNLTGWDDVEFHEGGVVLHGDLGEVGRFAEEREHVQVFAEHHRREAFEPTIASVVDKPRHQE